MGERKIVHCITVIIVKKIGSIKSVVFHTRGQSVEKKNRGKNGVGRCHT